MFVRRVLSVLSVHRVAMNACRRSLRLAGLLPSRNNDRKSITPTGTVGIASFVVLRAKKLAAELKLENGDEGEGDGDGEDDASALVVSSVESFERSSSPYGCRVRDKSRSEKLNLRSKRKLSFGGGQEKTSRRPFPSHLMKAQSFSVKQEGTVEGEDEQEAFVEGGGARPAPSKSRGKRKAKHNFDIPQVKEESNKPEKKPYQKSVSKVDSKDAAESQACRGKRRVISSSKTPGDKGGCGTKVELLALEAASRNPVTGNQMAVMQLEGPYPTFARPSVEECWEVRNRLHSLHGLGGEYVRPQSCPTIDPIAIRDPEEILALEYLPPQECVESGVVEDEELGELNLARKLEQDQGRIRVLTGSPSERHTVLDSLIGTILSQNTTDNNSRRAFASLKTAFPTWEEVQKADLNAVEDAIRCGGLAQIKAARIANILNTLLEERGSICLEYVRNMTSDQIKAELSRFKGVGPKTVACVLMFHLEHNEFPVDTHVHRLSKMLGWVPPNADREKAYLHLNKRVPNDIKFDLHCLLVTHGKRCPRCAKGGRAQTTPDGPCPLVNWSFKAVQENDSKGSISLLDQNAIKFLEG